MELDARADRHHLSRSAMPTAALSLTLYIIGVSRPLMNLCYRETQTGALSLQDLQYLIMMLSGMLLGTSVGPKVERALHELWHLLIQRGSFRDMQRRVCVTVILISSAMHPVFLLETFNQFVNAHMGLRTEVVFFVFVMGFATGGAWFVLLHRQVGWGIVFSCAMAMMVIASTLSQSSWS